MVTVGKVSHLELFPTSLAPSSRSANSSPIAASDASSFSPGASPVAAIGPNARAHTSSCISTITVLAAAP